MAARDRDALLMPSGIVQPCCASGPGWFAVDLTRCRRALWRPPNVHGVIAVVLWGGACTCGAGGAIAAGERRGGHPHGSRRCTLRIIALTVACALTPQAAYQQWSLVRAASMCSFRQWSRLRHRALSRSARPRLGATSDSDNRHWQPAVHASTAPCITAQCLRESHYCVHGARADCSHQLHEYDPHDGCSPPTTRVQRSTASSKCARVDTSAALQHVLAPTQTSRTTVADRRREVFPSAGEVSAPQHHHIASVLPCVVLSKSEMTREEPALTGTARDAATASRGACTNASTVGDADASSACCEPTTRPR